MLKLDKSQLFCNSTRLRNLILILILVASKHPSLFLSIIDFMNICIPWHPGQDPLRWNLLKQWFSTFFSSRHTKEQRKSGGTRINKSFVKYFKKSIFSQKRIGKVRNKKFGGTLVRSSRHTG